MKFIDKIKNYFYDEEEIVEPKKTEQPKVGVETKVKEEVKDNKSDNLDVISERELFKSDPTFNFPIIFDEEDFKEENIQNSRITVVKKEQTKIEETIERKVFKPSPIISPVYGLINDSQAEEKISPNSDSLLNLYEDNKKVNIDDVLGKAYEQKRVEIKKENYTEVKKEYDLPTATTDLGLDLFNGIEDKNEEEIKNQIEVTKESIIDVDEKLKTIDELLDNTNEEDFYSLVDSMYKENDEEGDK